MKILDNTIVLTGIKRTNDYSKNICGIEFFKFKDIFKNRKNYIIKIGAI